MDFWHIQLHPADRNSFTAEVVLSLLKEYLTIGIGEGWENDGGQPTHFSEWMNVGDIVAVRDGGTPLALVEVLGDCRANEQITDRYWFNLIRPVRILSLKPPSYPYGRYFNMTSCTLQAERTPGFVRFWYNSFLKEKMMSDYSKMLLSSYNLVLTGAPGTGKTFLARQIAEMIILGRIHDKDNPLTEDERSKLSEQTDFCQFHPSYDYTDFVEGLRPIRQKDGAIGFERTDGIFKAFCAKAAKAPADKKYIFIIDEINRGDIAKIFGELFFAIDPGYREEEVRITTQYENLIDKEGKDKDYVFKDGFYIPKNVLIIGTMNDIDRNVESMDFAIRRRFAWKKIAPDDTTQESTTQDAILSSLESNEAAIAKSRMNALNAVIRKEKSLGENFCVGAAYFIKKVDSTGDKWLNLWNCHLRPLLEEYVRGLPNAGKLMDSFKNAYDGKKTDTDADA